MSVVLVAHEPEAALAEAIRSLKNTDFLLVNSDNNAVFPFLTQNINNAKVITYGFNTKASITVSGISENAMQVCVQRGFNGAGGQFCEPREFSVPIPGEADHALTLSQTAAAIVRGICPVKNVA